MQIVETLNEGLRRAFTITIPASEIDGQVDAQLKTMAPRIKMPGFRPGKVPANLVRKMHGPALQQEALNKAVQDGVQKTISDAKLRPAMQPEVSLSEDYEPGKDAEITVSLEALPDLPEPNIAELKLERLTVEADDAAVDAALQKLADSIRSAVSEAISSVVGMEVTEVNVTVADVHIPSDDKDDDTESRVQ